MQVLVPVSIGELVDKITILQIKASRLEGQALAHVQQELTLLQAALDDSGIDLSGEMEQELKAINLELWEIEDAIRLQEAAGAFSSRFVELARSVYRCNDWRAAIKRRINAATGSSLIEEKVYPAYGVDS